MTEENDKMSSHDAPQHRLADLREWLMDQIDGSIETRGDDGLISDFIRQIDALSEKGATVEPRGCPTPGSCSAVEELADLKQRLLPQFQGRAQRAERDRDAAQVAAIAAERDAAFAKHERDALLEQLIEARSAIQQSYGCLWRYTGASNPMFLQARKMLLARLTKEQQAIGIRYANELFGPTTEHEILHSDCSHDAAPSATGATALLQRWYDLYGESTCDRNEEQDSMLKLDKETREYLAAAPRVEETAPDWAQQLPGAEIFDRAARYEYVRTLNPRQFAALFDEALHGNRFDDLVDRYRDASQLHKEK